MSSNCNILIVENVFIRRLKCFNFCEVSIKQTLIPEICINNYENLDVEKYCPVNENRFNFEVLFSRSHKNKIVIQQYKFNKYIGII